MSKGIHKSFLKCFIDEPEESIHISLEDHLQLNKKKGSLSNLNSHTFHAHRPNYKNVCCFLKSESLWQ